MSEYERKRELNRIAKKKYYQKNKAEICRKSIEWAKKNPEKIREIQKRSYENDIEYHKLRTKIYRENNLGSVLQKERNRNQTEEWKERNRKKIKSYRERNREKVKAAKLEFAKSFPEIVEAHRLVKNALYKEELTRPDKCSRCLKECKAEAHHTDYTKPLDVVWLCRSCHGREHRKYE